MILCFISELNCIYRMFGAMASLLSEKKMVHHR